jgi:hypothetical protein
LPKSSPAAFEFALFTDNQLAVAMLSIARTPYPHDRALFRDSLAGIG